MLLLRRNRKNGNKSCPAANGDLNELLSMNDKYAGLVAEIANSVDSAAGKYIQLPVSFKTDISNRTLACIVVLGQKDNEKWTTLANVLARRADVNDELPPQMKWSNDDPSPRFTNEKVPLTSTWTGL